MEGQVLWFIDGRVRSVWCVAVVEWFRQLRGTVCVEGVVEWDVMRHSCGNTYSECSNLFLDVVKKCVGGPPSLLLDGDGVDTVKFHSHGSSCSEGVTTHCVVGKSKLV
jgi:hypothetical protein